LPSNAAYVYSLLRIAIASPALARHRALSSRQRKSLPLRFHGNTAI